MIDICFITMFVWSVNAKLPSIACLAEQSSTICWRKGAINITGTGCTHFCSGSLEDKQWTVFLERCTFGKAARKKIFKFYRWNNTRFVVWENTLGLGKKSWRLRSLWASPTFEPVDSLHSDENNHTKNVHSTGEGFVFGLRGRIHLIEASIMIHELKYS